VLVEDPLSLDNLSPNERDSQNGDTTPDYGKAEDQQHHAVKFFASYFHAVCLKFALLPRD